ncbi:heterokaryon incompatibility protein-domain-containing protein [Nemania abortiva]|nr:heterokaryon incompatibility protein-domain-containing protein [Nemania abortiva]
MEIGPATDTDSDGARVRRRLYRPLGPSDYRVVHLLPGTFDDEVRCVLETRSSQIKFCHESLSYQWGDPSITKPIRIASAAPPSASRALASLEKVPGTLHDLEQKHSIVAKILVWLVVSSWLAPPLPFNPPSWVPTCGFVALYNFLVTFQLVDWFRIGLRLVLEIVDTKAWLAVRNLGFSNIDTQWRVDNDGERSSLEFGVLQVTSNLELALRSLRRENATRTLWIDALCINQEDKDEKEVQIQRMGWIYANAEFVVVWLGGYHGLGESVNGCTGGADCAHRRNVQLAFDYIWAVSGWRVFFGWCIGKRKRFLKAREGLRYIARTSWWERQWVIQEVALATSRVRIQCGEYVCDFGDVEDAQSRIMLNDWEPPRQMRDTIDEFRYAAIHDRDEGGIYQLIYNGWGKLIDMLTPSCYIKEIDFYKQLPAQRLQRILLRTAGRFKCSDDRDRVYGVLGISRGVVMGETRALADFVKSLSSPAIRVQIVSKLTNLYEGSIGFTKAFTLSIVLAYAGWRRFYDVRAKHWAINRPDYVVADFRDGIDPIAVKPGVRLSRDEFFTSIAGYLATQEKSLAFLDAVTCSESDDGTIPSWVPDWSRMVSKPAYEFAIRPKADLVSAFLGLADRGTTLQIAGRFRGKIEVIDAVDLDELGSSPWHGAFVKVLALPREMDRQLVPALRMMSVVAKHRSSSGSPFELSELEQFSVARSICLIRAALETGMQALREMWTAPLIYSHDARAVRQLGLLEVGNAASGDYMVDIPGCYHHLLLRERARAEGQERRWRLVGLVRVDSATAPRMDTTKEEWEELHTRGLVDTYDIC